jgi:hypothetical protein
MRAALDMVITAATISVLAICAFNAGKSYVRHHEICMPAPEGADVESFSMRPAQ